MRSIPPKTKQPLELNTMDVEPSVSEADLLESEKVDDMEEDYGNPDDNNNYAG